MKNRWVLALVYFLIPMVALGTFLGGPLYLADTLSSVTGEAGALVIVIAPVAVATACLFSLWRGHPWNWGIGAAITGVICVLLVSAMNVFAILQFMATPADADRWVEEIGVAVGCAAALVYLWLAFRRSRPATVTAPGTPR